MLFKLSPAKVLVFGILLYVMIYSFFPVFGNYSPSVGAVYYILASMIFLLAGCWIGSHLGGVKKLKINQVFNIELFKMVTTIALVGALFKVIDKFLIRGVSLTVATENRELLDVGSGNAFSLIGGILYPFCYVSLFVLLSPWKDEKQKLKRYFFLAVPLFFFPTFDCVLLGSRSLMIVNLTILLLYGMHFRFVRLNFMSVIALPVVVIVVGIFSASLFLERLDYMGMNYLTSSLHSVYGFTVEPNDWILGRLFNAKGFEFLLDYTLLNTGQYFTHGVFEFFYLYDHFDAENTYGAYNFGAYYKFIAMLTGDQSKLDAVVAAQPRIGTFTTFLGPVFVDFGIFGPFYMALFGVVAGRIWR